MGKITEKQLDELQYNKLQLSIYCRNVASEILSFGEVELTLPPQRIDIDMIIKFMTLLDLTIYTFGPIIFKLEYNNLTITRDD